MDYYNNVYMYITNNGISSYSFPLIPLALSISTLSLSPSLALIGQPNITGSTVRGAESVMQGSRFHSFLSLSH